MNDFAIGLIRTNVPIVVGAFFSWLFITFGIELDAKTQVGAIVALTGILQAGYYAAVVIGAKRIPKLGILLGINQAPSYNTRSDTSVDREAPVSP